MNENGEDSYDFTFSSFGHMLTEKQEVGKLRKDSKYVTLLYGKSLKALKRLQYQFTSKIDNKIFFKSSTSNRIDNEEEIYIQNIFQYQDIVSTMISALQITMSNLDYFTNLQNFFKEFLNEINLTLYK